MAMSGAGNPAGLAVVISGPSGAGKTSICKRLVERYGYDMSVSATTRPPRTAEQEAVEYHFISRKEFESRVARGEFLEHSEHFDNLYGTPRAPVERALREERVILLEIDVNGAQQVMDKLPEAFCVFVTAPGGAALEQRLRGRHSEDAASVRARLQRADMEIAMKMRYHARIVNLDLDKAVNEIHRLIEEEASKRNGR